MKPEFQKIQEIKEGQWKQRFEKCKSIKTVPWTIKERNVVLKNLKDNKPRDPKGYTSKIVKEDVAGKNLKEALPKLMNIMKQEQEVPDLIQLCNITTLYKNKGPRDEFGWYFGSIFRVSVLRSILERLVYNDTFKTIESNLTDCNVGNRRKRTQCSRGCSTITSVIN